MSIFNAGRFSLIITARGETMARWFEILTLIGLLFAGRTTADEPKTLAPGAKAPSWDKLPGVDNKPLSLDDFRQYKIVVLAFTCNSCPYSVAYEDRFVEFARSYEPKGVRFVAISVNNEEADQLPAMKVRAKEKAFAFPYLHDASQKTGRAYGATVTPHVFVLDHERNLAYVGGFDNARRAEKVTKHYVSDAVDALLSGKRPTITATRAAGCRIPYE